MRVNIADTNINTIKESGYTLIHQQYSKSAEDCYFGKQIKALDIKECQKHDNCFDCKQYCACYNIEI
jgi:hypothetical protein